MENEKHWRDIQESAFLAAWDFMVDKEQLTITEVRSEMAKLQKSEIKMIAHFKEEKLSCGTLVKPMILNNTNLKFLQEKTGLRHQKLWKNVKVEISVMDNKSAIGGKKKLVITKCELPKFDLKDITSLTDHGEAKKLASQFANIMTAEEIESVKAHLETIKSKANE